ncbi:PREDICTED: putative protein kinase C delta type homolog [Rhagoletis zephyria]|uniref:putative protein kinase C delta type homolog n=1 Tax=Rhagoletis zephyria TaxID=28612 RepID=UPI0008118010|nr:PREDICTED: putative protein kinase C delta type homolog [Rhagoletis zephyria]
MAMSASAAVLCPDVIVAVETQFARLTTAAPAGPADCSVAATEAPAKTTIKKKKKKVKASASGTTSDKPVKKTRKKKAATVTEPVIQELLCPLEDEPIDPNEPTKIRFRRYDVQDFKPLTLVGTGGFGMVYLCKLVGHNAYFAVKFMEKRRIEEQNDYEAVLMEKKMMLYGNKNPFICRLFCAFQTTRHLCFAMEFCCGGDLRFHLDREKRFSIDKMRDLKLDNVMIFSNGHIKLVDFGMCLGKVYRQEFMPSDFCGTLEYMAPENSPRDTSHFEEAFTAEKRNFFNVGGCTPSDNFADFEYTNPNMTD